jgi:hypothetical protein
MKIPKSMLKAARQQARESRRDIRLEAYSSDPEKAAEASEMIQSAKQTTIVQRWMPNPGELVKVLTKGSAWAKHNIDFKVCLAITSDTTTGYVNVLDSSTGSVEEVFVSRVRPMIDDENP